MTDMAVDEEALYAELYDVRREAEAIGNLVEDDVNPGMNALRERGGIQKGALRDLMGLGAHHRSAMAEGRDGYTCFSWAACEAAFRDNRRLSSTILAQPGAAERRLAFLEMDEPEHLAYRRTVQPMFIKPRAESWWRKRWIDGTIAGLIDAIGRSDRAELNLQLCARVPVHTITQAMGLRGEDALVFRHALIRSNPRAGIPVDEVRQAAATVDRMLGDVIAARRDAPADDIVSGMIRAEFVADDGVRRPLTDREILLQAKLIMLAGGGTSWRQMGITLWALLTHADQFDAVKADRTLIDAAIQEGVRWNPTDPVFTRLAVEDFETAEGRIPAGAVVDVCLGAANRDPSRWDRPDDFDLHRKPQPHLGFGIGVHQCLGRNVAAVEIGDAVNALLDAFPNIRLDPDAPASYLTGGLEQRGMSSIHVRLD